MSYSRIGAVTGGNKGVGFAVVRQLALQYPKSPYNNGPLLIYLAARDQTRGEQAVKDMLNDEQLKKAKVLKADGGLTDIKFTSLDITKTQSIKDFASFLKREHPEGIDFIVNNAGIAEEGFNVQIIETTLGCNYYGTLEANNDVLPLIKDGGRLVNVASMAGLIQKYSPEIQDRFRSASTVPEVTKLMQDFKQAAADGKCKERGWTEQAYSASKAGVIGYTRVLAKESQEKGSKTLINSCCPGYVNTDMTKHRGQKTPDQGAMTPTMLAIGEIGGQTGLFWQDEKVLPW